MNPITYAEAHASDPERFQVLTAAIVSETISETPVWRVESDETGLVGMYVADNQDDAVEQGWQDLA